MNFGGIILFFAVIFFALIAAGWIFESPSTLRFDLAGQLGGALLLLAIAALSLWTVHLCPIVVVFDPATDLQDLGLLPFLWAYATASRVPPTAVSPFRGAVIRADNSRPHLVAIQNGPLSDASALCSGFCTDLLKTFDRLRSEDIVSGPLAVPAWGANVSRAEFSFLTGISAQRMGIHRFYPYQAIARGWGVESLPLVLRKLGYHTVCIHPHCWQLAGQGRILRQLGFDECVDINLSLDMSCDAFYANNISVGEYILHLLKSTEDPTFIFAVTIDCDKRKILQPYCYDILKYFHHKHNLNAHRDSCLHDKVNSADGFKILYDALSCYQHPVSMCCYGGCMPSYFHGKNNFYENCNYAQYFYWANKQVIFESNIPSVSISEIGNICRYRPLILHQAATDWLASLGILEPQ